MLVSTNRRRQPLLLHTEGPWASRFEPGFFKALPDSPGVYFFYDAAGALLYIGQSGCLKDRIRSYRHADPERHPRRILRLIQRTGRITWCLCASAAEAVALEAVLLREHRPPFNRAGVWPVADAWLGLGTEEGQLELRLAKKEPEAEDWTGEWIGPLPGRFRRAFAPLTRCLFRVLHPESDWWDFPSRLLGPEPGPVQVWRDPGGSEPWLSALKKFLGEGCPAFLAALSEQIAEPGRPEPEREFWAGQLEPLDALHRALGHRRQERVATGADGLPALGPLNVPQGPNAAGGGASGQERPVPPVQSPQVQERG